MFAIIHLLAAFIADLFKPSRRLEVENLFLRHQLNIALRGAQSGGIRDAMAPRRIIESTISLRAAPMVFRLGARRRCDRQAGRIRHRSARRIVTRCGRASENPPKCPRNLTDDYSENRRFN